MSSEPKLGDYLCFAIYSANLAFGKAYKPILERLGLTYTQYITVVALWEHKEQTVGQLGDKLFLESNTLTPILKKLASLGYVTRQRDPLDERQVLVRLTAEGWRLRERLADQSLYEACGMGAADFAAVRGQVVRVRDNLVRSMLPYAASVSP